MYRRVFILQLAGMFLGLAASADAQSNIPPRRIFESPAVSGYEQPLISEIRERLQALSPKTDNLGDLYVTFGSGVPHRLIVTPIDEPGYVVSGITTDGFLRVQRLPQVAPNAVFDTLHFAQPVSVVTRGGKKVNGVFAGLSIHLQPGRRNAPTMSNADELFVDIGASSAAEVRTAGVDLLDPVVGQIDTKTFGTLFGRDILNLFLRKLQIKDIMHPMPPLRGSLTVAFVTQQWTGGRGLDRLLNEIHPDEMIYLGRIQPSQTSDSPRTPKGRPSLGDGILLGVDETSTPSKAFAAELVKVAGNDKASGFPITVLPAAPPRIASNSRPTPLPERFVQIGIPTLFPVTPGEVSAASDVYALAEFFYRYLFGVQSGNELGQMGGAIGTSVSGLPLPEYIPLNEKLRRLVETFGVSGHEQAVRKKIESLLPDWAQDKTETDSAGNLILHLVGSNPEAKTQRIIFVAHMDEIGYEVKSVEPDGSLLVDVLGGGYSEYFLGHPVLVHNAYTQYWGVLELPDGWDKPGFEWPHGPRSMDGPARVYVFTRSAKETEERGIAKGDWVTIPKKYRPLLGTRANGRSFDDRVGCAALIEAVESLGPNLPGRDVTFVWSTEEEVGLKGAAAYAERSAKEGKTPDFVFAIDTFVSSDSPLESKRFADAEIGKGFVIRAVDNSNITPREYVDRVIKLAHENKIPVQSGVTGGGNDGAVFTRYGSVDIPLGWPLRYSHSPGEVIDTRDLDSLSKIITVLAKEW
jgi:putative aminopeptidase